MHLMQVFWFGRVEMYLLPQAHTKTTVGDGLTIHFPSFWKCFFEIVFGVGFMGLGIMNGSHYPINVSAFPRFPPRPVRPMRWM